MTGPGSPPIDGDRLRAMFAAAASHLESLVPAINAINVYPVPDGDTGSNMSATLREAVMTATEGPSGANAGSVLAAVARGALFGARGNSGVILSQALRGLADALEGREVIDATAWANALQSAARRAYSAVADPREGTMLTVLRAAGEGAAATVLASPTCSPADVFAAAVAAAEIAEAGTIEQLPQLREAGVTDSGGEGICVILRGLHASLVGAPQPAASTDPAVVPNLHSFADETYGRCTEFLLERDDQSIDVEALRQWLVDGDSQSIVVVGDDDLARVHVHTMNPDAVLSYAAQLGRLRRVKVDDMDMQSGRFAATGSGATAKVAVLALSPGEGFDAILAGLGATTLRLELVKPAAGEIARAADALRIPDVVVLPNHENVVWAARQAMEIAGCTLHVVATVTVPQGIAAALAFDAALPTDRLVPAMEQAIASVRTVEVTRAAASRTVEGVEVREGQALVLVDTRVVTALDDPIDALIAGLTAAASESAELVSVYIGEGQMDQQGALEAAVAAAFPDVGLEVLDGGQPLYMFIASVE